MLEKPVILLIGPTPPPYHGVSTAMQILLTSPIADTFRLVHLDISDRRGISHVDRPDLHDVFLFAKQILRNLALIVRERPALFYLPISQTRLGFLRDSFFILPALMARIPVIVHLHGAHFEELYAGSGLFWKAYMGAVLRRISRFIVLGDMLRPIFSRWTAPDRISVVPNGVRRDADSERPRRVSTRSDGNPFRVIFLSSLSRQKGLLMLLQAIPPVLNAHPDVEFLIAGPWWGEASRREAGDYVASFGITEKVCFIGPVTGRQKSEFLRSGDLFVFPGIQQEGQPMTVLEAMSEGLPVIATDRGCLKETVIDGITGFIVPPNSPGAIAEKIIRLIRDPALRTIMAANALRRVEECYTVERFASRLSGVFLQTISSTPGRNADRSRVGCRL